MPIDIKLFAVTEKRITPNLAPSLDIPKFRDIQSD